MALEAPLRSSTGNLLSPFSPHTDIMSSPDSPTPSHFRPKSAHAPESSSLRPSMAARPSSASNLLMSPSDIVGPSPVTSVGTEVTEIEDEMSPEVQSESSQSNPESNPQLLMLRTNISDQLRQNAGEEAVSVIHAPESFQSWAASDTASKTSESTQRTSPKTPPKPYESAADESGAKGKHVSMPNPPPLSTDVKPVRFSLDSQTPRAQSLQEVQGFMSDSSRLRSSSASSLELIPETKEPETDAEPLTEGYDYEDYPTPSLREERDEREYRSLKSALSNCWTLCNTLATLSSHHRERMFSTSGTPDGHERAWKCCWKLCQRLYENQDEDSESLNVRMNLDLCRDFCQSLFDVRQRKDEVADSVLRVSFELNNHLYSAQDNRYLPEAFRERTLDFYITLCHRLMKQRGELAVAEETDALLRACWSLAEMLFSLRQNRRDGRVPDEELLGSAVQACWELCDIFREGWTQIRPDRGTPRPSQMNFFGGSGSGSGGAYSRDPESDGGAGIPRTSSRASNRSKRESLKSLPPDRDRDRDRDRERDRERERDRDREKSRKHLPVPETPVTEFEDTPISPDSPAPPVPNILVLGTDNGGGNNSRGGGGGSGPGAGGGRWSSSASNLSSYSQSSHRTSSTATTATTAEDVNVTRIKTLIVKAAMNVGYSREREGGGGGEGGGGPSSGSTASLQAFVKALPTGSFGSLPAHTALLQSYRNLVLADPAFRQASTLPPRGKRVLATDVAKSVAWMLHRSNHDHRHGQHQYGFLRELFKLVFGFHVDEAEARKNVSIAV